MAEYNYVRKSIVYEGKRYYVRGKTEREALKKLATLEAELHAGTRTLNSKTTVKRWSKEWLDVYVSTRDITKKSVRMYKEKLDNHILPAIGAMRLIDVRDTHLRRLLNDCAAKHSWSTVQKVRIILKAMFRQARVSRLITYDPAEVLELPKATKGKRRSITDYEREHILAVAETHHAGLYVLMILYCGIRPNEAAALQWKDIYYKKDEQRYYMRIDKALESGDSSSIKAPKTAAGVRDIPIPNILWEQMEPRKGQPFEYVLLQPRGKKRHTESSLHSAWQNFKRHLDIHMGAEVYRNQIIKHGWELHPLLESEDQWKSLVPYCLRHTYGTDMQRAFVPINVTKYLMGHSDISVTANTYTDTTPDVVAAAAVAQNTYLSQQKEKKPGIASAAS